MDNNRTKPCLKLIPLDLLVRGKFQPRVEFDEHGLEELAQSIQINGLLQPIIARPIANNKYEIIAGERRWRAAQKAGLNSVYCLVNVYTDEQAAGAAAIENLNRMDLNPIEEANAYLRLINEFKYSHEEVAATLGKSRAKITNSLRLLKLSPQIQKMIINNEISEGHGKVLASLHDSYQQRFAQKCKQLGWSVRQLEKAVKLLQQETQYKSSKDPNLSSLEIKLSQYIGCPVTLEYNDGKGKLIIYFHNNEALEGLFSKMNFFVNDSDS